jgi:hypothetical protein
MKTSTSNETSLVVRVRTRAVGRRLSIDSEYLVRIEHYQNKLVRKTMPMTREEEEEEKKERSLMLDNVALLLNDVDDLA